MSTHKFSFVGGDILTAIGASWFVSYAYYEMIDRTHKNWDNVSTAKNRISKYHKGKPYHRDWLLQIINMNPANLNKNTIGLNSERTKGMARELLDRWK